MFLCYRYIPDPSHVLTWDSVQLDEQLTFVEEPMLILVHNVRWLCTREIPIVKVQWRHCPVEEATWEIKADMHSKYPHLFADLGNSLFSIFIFCYHSRMNSYSIGI